MKNDKNINGTEQDEMKIVLPLNEAEETRMRNAKRILRTRETVAGKQRQMLPRRRKRRTRRKKLTRK